jgi:hypothetical protein
MSTSDFSPGHRALPRIFANPKESQLAEITQLLFQSGSYTVSAVEFFALSNTRLLAPSDLEGTRIGYNAKSEVSTILQAFIAKIR